MQQGVIRPQTADMEQHLHVRRAFAPAGSVYCGMQLFLAVKMAVTRSYTRLPPTTILPDVLYGYETWSLSLGEWRHYKTRSLMISTSHQIQFG